jgi:hypothetical protein
LFPTKAPTKNPNPNTKGEQQSYNERSIGSEPTDVDVAAPAAAASGLGVVFEIGLGVCLLGLGLCLVVKTLKGRKAEQLLKEDGPIDAQQQGDLFNDAPTNPTTNPLNPLNTREEPIDFGILSHKNPLTDVQIGIAGKFVIGKLITGQPQDAAFGLAFYMGIDQIRLGQIIQDGLTAIRKEFMASGSESEVKIMEYILDEVAVVKQEKVSYGLVMRDEGHDKMRLEDFLKLKEGVTAKLNLSHVAALRLYTSQAYKCINDPLRKGEKPHPFAATTYFLSEALKQLRAVNAQGAEAQQRKEFWRGMKVCLHWCD